MIKKLFVVLAASLTLTACNGPATDTGKPVNIAPVAPATSTATPAPTATPASTATLNSSAPSSSTATPVPPKPEAKAGEKVKP